MTLSDDDFDVDVCPDCGRPHDPKLARLARAGEVVWIFALLCVIVSSIFVAVFAVGALT